MSRKKPDIVVPYDSKAKSNDLIVNIAQTKRYADIPIVSSMVKYIKYLKQK